MARARKARSTVKAGRHQRSFPSGTTVAKVKAIIAPAGENVVLVRGNKVLKDGERLRAGLIYVAQPEIDGGA